MDSEDNDHIFLDSDLWNAQLQLTLAERNALPDDGIYYNFDGCYVT